MQIKPNHHLIRFQHLPPTFNKQLSLYQKLIQIACTTHCKQKILLRKQYQIIIINPIINTDIAPILDQIPCINTPLLYIPIDTCCKLISRILSNIKMINPATTASPPIFNKLIFHIPLLQIPMLVF